MFFYILAIFGFYKFTQFMGWEFTSFSSFAGLFLIASGCLYFTIKMAKNAGAR